MASINISHLPARKLPWRAQWVTVNDGKRKTPSKYFASEAEALSFRDTFQRETAAAGDLTAATSERARWWRLTALAAAHGHTLEDLVAAGIEAKHLIKTAANSTSDQPAALAIELWSRDAERRNLLPKTVKNVTYSVSTLLHGKPVNVRDLTPSALLTWLTTFPSDASRLSHRKNVLSWLRWCAAAPRRWCPTTGWEAVTWPRSRTDTARIGFYSLAQAQGLLAASPARLRPAVALGMLAGLRPGEIERMKVAETRAGVFYGIDFEKKEIHVAADWSKVRKYRRLYELPASLWPWLEPLRSPNWGRKDPEEKSVTGKKRGGRPCAFKPGAVLPMNPRNARALWDRVLTATKLDNIPDGLRHTFASHGYHRGIEWILDILGHQTGLRMLKKHYQGAVTADEGRAFFQKLTPHSLPAAAKPGLPAQSKYRSPKAQETRSSKPGPR